MKRYWTGIALALGPAIVIATIVWEIVRTNPAYGYLVDPWSMKSYDTTQGWVFFWMGIGLFVGAMLVIWEGSTRGFGRLAVLGYFVLAGAVLTAVFAPNEHTTTVSTVLGIVLAVLVTLIIFRFSVPLLARRIRLFSNGWVRAAFSVVAMVVIYLILAATLVGNVLTLNTAVGVTILLALLAVYASAAEPRGLAANRLLIYVSMLSTFVIVRSSGALRMTLLRVQVETEGVSAQYKDVQVGLAWFLGVFGCIVLFTGAVGLWAKRRDLLIAMARARRQREAAETSAAEIRAAEEAYLAETASHS